MSADGLQAPQQAEDNGAGKEKVPYAQRVAQQLIVQLEAGTAPWQRPWDPDAITFGRPMNPVSGKPYHGINAVYLMAQGHDDPRWCTYKQAAAEGWQIRRGEKGTTVEYWQWEKEEKQADGSKRNVKMERPKVFWATVFHASQIDGIPPYVVPERTWDPQERAEALLQASGAWIDHRAGNEAFYSPASDRIILPLKEQFAAGDRYYATALHELGHWTGHPARLSRDLLNGTFASPEYALEELRAEISSLMVGTELGVGHDPGQHAAYVKSWVKALKDDPREIFRAAADAEKIFNFVLAFDRQHVLDKGKQQEQQRPTVKAPEEQHAPASVREPVATRQVRKPQRDMGMSR